MLQAGPKIHGHRTDLYLHLGIHYAVRKIHRHRHNHVITFVAAGFGIGNIILLAYNLDVLLLPDHLGNLIDIGSEGTDNPNAGNIVNILHHIVNGGFMTMPFQFLDNALRCLDPRFDMFNGIILMHMLKFVIQNLYLGFHLFQRRIIYQIDLLPTVNSIIIINS